MLRRTLPIAFVLSACGSMQKAPIASPSRDVRTSSPAGTTGSSPTPSCLTIVAWNDLHGQITPDEPPVSTGPLAVGGVIALADEVAEVRARGDAVVVLDAGDLFTGPLESTLAEGAPIVTAYNAIGVDAVAIGNHEFDFGPAGYERVTASAGVTDAAGSDGPRGALLARMSAANFPFLSANLHRASGEAVGWPNEAASTIVHRGGFDVGVVGYSTLQTPTTTLKKNVVGLDFSTHAAESVAAEVKKLRAAGASPIVLLAHASLEGELPELLDDPTDPQGTKHTGEIASLIAALGSEKPDLVVAGHRHAWMLGRVDGVPIVSSDQHGIGAAEIRYCPRDGKMELRAIDRRVNVATIPPRTPLGVKVAGVVQPYLDAVKDKAEAPVATLPHACSVQALDGSAASEQIARAIAEHASDAAMPPKGVPVVAVTNSGGLRAPLAAGRLRYADLFASFPFENAVSVCGTTRAGLERALKNALDKPSVAERFPFGISGAKLKLRRRPDDGLTLLRVDIAGAAKGPDAPVWLVLPDFLLDGGDGFLRGVTCNPSVASTTRVRDAWRDALARDQGGCEGGAKNIVIEPK